MPKQGTDYFFGWKKQANSTTIGNSELFHSEQDPKDRPNNRECLTSEEVEEDLFQHGFVDLRVGDGVKQPAFLLTGEDELAQLLPVNLPALQQDLRAKVPHYLAKGRTVGLHYCNRNGVDI